MYRFNGPKISSLLKSIEENSKKVLARIYKVSKKSILIAVIIVTLLVGNSAFWVYRATRGGINLGNRKEELKQWDIDLNEDYLDAEGARQKASADSQSIVTDTPEKGIEDSSTSKETEAENAVPQENIEVSVPSEANPDVAVEPVAETVQAVAKADVMPALSTMALPTLGKVMTEHSIDKLIYSKTLEQWNTHPGIDIAAEEGTQVKAAMEGTVSEVRNNDPKLGIVAVIDHGGGVKTLYGNLASDNLVKEGDDVKKGQVIGAVGKTALYEIEDPPHLHFEVTKDGAKLDPQLYLPKLN